jgi:hypothetical protein
VASDVAGTNEDGDLHDIISTIDNDTYQQLTSDMKDPLFETSLARALRGKNTEEITKIFRYLDKQKKGLLKKSLQDHYGKELAFDDEGNVSNTHSMHYRALRGDADAPYHDPTDTRVQQITQRFSEKKPSLKGYDPTGKKPDEVIKYASTSKEVSEQFLKNVLKADTSLTMKNHYSLMKAMFEEALTSCMKKYGLTSAYRDDAPIEPVTVEQIVFRALRDPHENIGAVESLEFSVDQLAKIVALLVTTDEQVKKIAELRYGSSYRLVEIPDDMS